MNVQQAYDEWKWLVEKGKLIESRKRELRSMMKLTKESHVPTHPRSNNERDKNMVSLYHDGKTMQQISDIHGITRERVRQIISRHGVTGRRIIEKRRVERLGAVKAMAEEGKTVEEIAGELGDSVGAVKNFAFSNNIELLTEWELKLKKRDEQVVDMYESGKTQVQIAKKMKTAQANVSRILIKHGAGRDKISIDEALRLRSKGYAVSDIAMTLGCTPANVYRIYRERGEETINE